mgnify:CR=1 FL=1
MCEEYIEPIGYEANNLFLVEWDEENFQQVNFNDLYDFLYRMDQGSLPDSSRYPDGIGGSEFEDLIEKYSVFLGTISAGRLQQPNRHYPWTQIAGSNSAVWTEMDPEVVDARDNGDGTITMTVDVVSPQLRSDKTLLPTMSPCAGRTMRTDFLYVSNTLEPGGQVPPYTPRTAAGQ